MQKSAILLILLLSAAMLFGCTEKDNNNISSTKDNNISSEPVVNSENPSFAVCTDPTKTLHIIDENDTQIWRCE